MTKLTPQLKTEIRKILQKRSPEFLNELKTRVNKIKLNDNINLNTGLRNAGKS